MLDHAITKTSPAKTKGHVGAHQYSPYPSMAQRHEEHQRAATAITITDPTARVLVEAVQEVLARSEEANGRHRRT